MDYDSEEEEEESKEKSKVPYFHLIACKNGDIAELDANFSRKVYLTGTINASRSQTRAI